MAKQPTKKQKEAVRIMVEDGSLSARKVLLKAGYSQAISRQPHKVLQSDGFIALAERYLPTDKILAVAEQGLSATKVTRYKGQEYEDTDHYARHLFLQTALKIRGLAQTSDTPIGDVNIQVINYNDTEPKNKSRGDTSDINVKAGKV